jgi:hypothetical protein
MTTTPFGCTSGLTVDDVRVSPDRSSAPLEPAVGRGTHVKTEVVTFVVPLDVAVPIELAGSDCSALQSIGRFYRSGAGARSLTEVVAAGIKKLEPVQEAD